jgi:hypothetical protein
MIFFHAHNTVFVYLSFVFAAIGGIRAGDIVNSVMNLVLVPVFMFCVHVRVMAPISVLRPPSSPPLLSTPPVLQPDPVQRGRAPRRRADVVLDEYAPVHDAQVHRPRPVPHLHTRGVPA